MYHPSVQTITLLFLAIASNVSASSVGDAGTLSSLDGGLGGVVTVADDKTLKVSSYKLADASAPALYWWGSTSEKLDAGFRISNTHITTAASSDSLTITLDAGKTPADFTVVGLWCEKFKTNFGQAVLKSNGNSGNSSSSGGSGSDAKAGGDKKGAGVMNQAGPMVGLLAGAAGFALAMF
ncbi:hypothetical protein PT974_04619 [Cladobotryum mycophilum]|uniref:DM13 domain-containing protein n=1 Tax=Cladobotryum mycophilum TaxID=491253 RepID=A0ABR0SVJ7_9HYPO